MAKKKTPPSTKWQDMADAISSLVEESPLVISNDEHNAVRNAWTRIHVYLIRMESNKRLSRFIKQHPKYYKKLSGLTGHCIQYIEPDIQQRIGTEKYLKGQPVVYVHQVCLYDDLLDYRVVLKCRIAKPRHWEDVDYSFELEDLASGKVKLQPVPNSNKLDAKMAKRFMPLGMVFNLGRAPRDD